ncbi:MAG: hypothetical protein ACK5F1_01360 [Burkholderiales bacterium]|jgi:hypothetical protein
MSNNVKLVLLLVAGLAAVFLFIDQVVCNRWSYHDYAAGIDRRFICPWQ